VLLRFAAVRSGLRKALLAILAVGLLVLLLYKLRGSVHLSGFRWSLLLTLPAQANLWLLLLSIATIYLCYAIRALRWTCFARSIGPASFKNIFTSTMMGFTCVFLLGRVGEPIRPMLIARKDKVPLAGTFGIYVLERIFDLSATAVAAGIAFLVIGKGVALRPEAAPLLAHARHAGTGLLLGALGAIAFLAYIRLHGAGALAARLDAAGKRRPQIARVAGLFSAFVDGLHCLRNMTDLAVAVGLTALHWFFNTLVYLWVINSFGGRLADFHLGDALLVMVFTLVGSALQLPGVGGGSQLATFLVLTVIYGVESERAAVAAIVVWLITFTAVSLAGVPLLLREGWSLGDLRRLAREERAAEAAGGHTSAPVMPSGPHDPHAPHVAKEKT